jgi:rod shape determining protein RodA
MTAITRGRGIVASAYEERRVDFFLIGAVLLLAALSILMIYSASAPRAELLGLDTGAEARKQAVVVLAGLAVFTLGSLAEHRTMHTAAPVLYLGAAFALVAVLTFGDEVNGARSWFGVFSFRLQPSEWAKPAVILTVAALLAPVAEGKIGWRRLAVAFGLLAIPTFLIFRQPDLGTLLVFAFVMAVMLYAAGARWMQLIMIFGTALVVVLVAYNSGTLGLAEERIDAWLNPERYELDAAFQPQQSKIAIGSGGFTGNGLFESGGTTISFIPEQTTDFIFTAVGNQLGFVGAALVIGIYAVIVWRLLRTAVAAPDRFGMLVAIGVAAMIVFHVFINVGMTVGLMPVTGIPLPLLSAGGSSFTAFAFSLGFVHSIWRHRSMVPPRKPTLA